MSRETVVNTITSFCRVTKVDAREKIRIFFASYGDLPNYPIADVHGFLWGDEAAIPYRRPLNRRPDNKPDGAFTAKEAGEHLGLIDVARADGRDSFAALTHGLEPVAWYYRGEVEKVALSGKAPEKTTPIPTELLPRPGEVVMTSPSKRGIVNFQVRSDTSGLLNDISSRYSAPGDNVGATFSYSYNDLARSNTWAVNGAAILAIDLTEQIRNAVPDADWFRGLVFGPSVYVNWLSNNKDASQNVDEMLYQFNVKSSFSLWADPRAGAAFLQVRAQGVYGTTTGQTGSLYGLVVEIEPQYYVKIGGRRSSAEKDSGDSWGFPLCLGFEGNVYSLASDVPEPEDGWKPMFTYALRSYLHLEAGGLDDAPAGWMESPGGFARLGPVLGASLSVPRLNGLTLSAGYTYLFTLAGPNGNNGLFTAKAAWPLYKSDDGFKVTVNLNYNDGGLLLTKQEVRYVTMGLGIVY